MVSNQFITITLVSIPEVVAIPEYATPNEPNTSSRSELSDPFVDDDVPRASLSDQSRLSGGSQCACSPVTSVFALKSLVAGSQFWIHYKIAPPHLQGIYYYFKLAIDGAPTVSWGAGFEDSFRGTVKSVPTQDGIACSFHIPDDENGEDENSLSVDRPTSLNSNSSQATIAPTSSLEFRVYRSIGRERCEVFLADDVPHLPLGCGSSVNLVPSVKLSEEQPQEHYIYELIDPIDLPFATFRYQFKSLEELEALGIDVESPMNRPSPPSPLSTLWETSSLDSACVESSIDGGKQLMSPLQQDFNEDSPESIENEPTPDPDSSITTPASPPLSVISKNDSESSETSQTKESLVLAYGPSVEDLKSSVQEAQNETQELPATPPPVSNTLKAWPLDIHKPLPDLPSEESTPRPRGGQGSSHALLVTRFPKFASSSTLMSTSTLASTVSEVPSDPFLIPGSPLGRGDPLPPSMHPGGLRCHPPPRLRPLGSSPIIHPAHLQIPETSNSSLNSFPSSSANPHANSLGNGGGFARTESVASIGRAVSRPDKQRPPTPIGHGLDEELIVKGAETELSPRLGSPPVWFPQPKLPQPKASPGSSGDSVAESPLPSPKAAPAMVPAQAPLLPHGPEPVRSPVPIPPQFPVRKSSIRSKVPFGRKRPYSFVSTSSTASAVSGSEADHSHSASYLASCLDLSDVDDGSEDDPRTPRQQRRNLSKFFGEHVDEQVLSSARHSLTDPGAGPGLRSSLQRLTRKESVLAMGKEIGRDVLDSARKFNARTKVEWEDLTSRKGSSTFGPRPRL